METSGLTVGSLASALLITRPDPEPELELELGPSERSPDFGASWVSALFQRTYFLRLEGGGDVELELELDEAVWLRLFFPFERCSASTSPSSGTLSEIRSPLSFSFDSSMARRIFLGV